jgi:geranylgeranyl diphosphate synthase type I
VISSDAELRQRVNSELRAFLDDAVARMQAAATDLQPFAAALRSFVVDGGKRLRPAFCYWTYVGLAGNAASNDESAVVRAAASLELLQAAALIHDDVIDNSSTRRGKPSLHEHFAALHSRERWHGATEDFGRAAAILLGDLALVWADAMLASSGLDATRVAAAQPVWAAMRSEVMGGQYLDLLEQAMGGGSVSRALAVARLKSAHYTVERPLHLGAAFAGADPGVRLPLSEFGLPLGEAFQLRDDLLGVFGDPQETGKPAGDDLREGKRTVLVALATEAASDEQRRQLTALIGDPALDDNGVETLRRILIDTGSTRRIEQMIVERMTAATTALDALPISGEGREQLRLLAKAATERVG